MGGETFTRVDFDKALAKLLPHLSGRQLRNVIDDTLEAIAAALEAEEDVILRGFGKFWVQHKVPRPGRNPKTGKAAVITARKVLGFSAAPGLRDRLNE